MLTGFRKNFEMGLPTFWGQFRVLAFQAVRTDMKSGEETLETALALVHGDLSSSLPLIRFESQCEMAMTSQSPRCDCFDYLLISMRTIAEACTGIIVLGQRERLGLEFLDALLAHEMGGQELDTIEPDRRLRRTCSLQGFELPIEILRSLKIRSIRLMPNNPAEVGALLSAGIEIKELVRIQIRPKEACVSQTMIVN